MFFCGRIRAQLAAVLGPLLAEDQLVGQDAVLQALLLGVDVGEEEVEGGDALDQALFELLPFVVRNHARDEVEGQYAFGALVVAVDREGDALVEQREVLQLLATLDLGGIERAERSHQLVVVRARLPSFLEDLVVAARLAQPLHGAISLRLDGKSNELGRGLRFGIRDARDAGYSTTAMACAETRRKPKSSGLAKMRGSCPGMSFPPRRMRRIFLKDSTASPASMARPRGMSSSMFR